MRVGVSPPEAARSRPRLLSAVGAALGVRIEAGTGSCDAWLAFGDADVPPGRPCLRFSAGEGAAGTVSFGTGAGLDFRLRGRHLRDRRAGAPPVAVEAGATVLATGPAGPLWTLAPGGQHHVAVTPAELDPGARLDELVAPGDFLSLLPLIAFLRDVAGGHGWAPPPLRALFMFDDPNLHRARYGHIDYAALVAHATEHDYHVAMAMVPLDGSRAAAAALRIFRDHPDRLSLLMHGNNHTRHELAVAAAAPASRRLLAQALRRIAAFEARTGLEVARFMAPPHGRCSEATARAMLELGFEGLCADFQYPWDPPAAYGRPLAGLLPSHHIAGGLPVFVRREFSTSPETLVLQAWLDQPLILYGHHGDVAGGLEILASSAALCRGLGVQGWGSCRDIGRGAFATRRRGAALEVRLHANRIELDVPAGVESVRLRLPLPQGVPLALVARVGGTGVALETDGDALASPDVAVRGGERVTVSVLPAQPLDSRTEPAPATSPWPLVRRALVEARDRSLPAARRFAGSGSQRG